MKASWESGDLYEQFMGRWSRLVANTFVDWLACPPGLAWLDVGCGSGALSGAIAYRVAPAAITAIDQSRSFVATTIGRFGNPAQGVVADALALPLTNGSIDATVSGLVLNFINDPQRALNEMKRVTRPGGTIAVYVWDYDSKMEFLSYFWDTATDLNPGALSLHEGNRFPDSSTDFLIQLFTQTGLSKIEPRAIVIETLFSSFEDYWQPFLGGQGPAPTYLQSLNSADRNRLRQALLERLPLSADGSILLTARAWAVRGQA